MQRRLPLGGNSHNKHRTKQGRMIVLPTIFHPIPRGTSSGIQPACMHKTMLYGMVLPTTIPIIIFLRTFLTLMPSTGCHSSCRFGAGVNFLVAKEYQESCYGFPLFSISLSLSHKYPRCRTPRIHSAPHFRIEVSEWVGSPLSAVGVCSLEVDGVRIVGRGSSSNIIAMPNIQFWQTLCALISPAVSVIGIVGI